MEESVLSLGRYLSKNYANISNILEDKLRNIWPQDGEPEGSDVDVPSGSRPGLRSVSPAPGATAEEAAAVPEQALPQQPYLDSEVGPPYSGGRGSAYVEDKTAGSPEPAARTMGSDREATSPEAGRSETRPVAAGTSVMEDEKLVSVWVESDDKKRHGGRSR